MLRALFLFSLIVAAFCAAVDDPWAPVGYKTCRETFEWNDCSGLCHRTCEDRNPMGCLIRLCAPGCKCPEGMFMNRFSECVEEHHCLER